MQELLSERPVHNLQPQEENGIDSIENINHEDGITDEVEVEVEKNELPQRLLKQIIRKQNIIEATLLQLVNNVNYLKTKENVKQKLVADSNLIFPVFDIHLKDDENLLQLEQYLENEEQTNDTIQGLSRIGGLNREDFVKRVTWEKEQARLLKLYEEMCGSSSNESESDADSAENNSSGSEDNESTTDEEYEAPEEPENDETWHTNNNTYKKLFF
ncbi:hypothetical protein FQA39_LY13795 [Lamprigera yunnana]|nr:hypothetical protein FQA39_LY13795 [Lamprigera yunnana]